MADPSPSPGPRELPHLATFARAAERGSFTDAAADLGVTQAAVSQRIAVLEKELRVSLFNRRAGRIALTEAGERLYELARRILDLHEEAREILGGFHPSVAGDLAIAASENKQYPIVIQALDLRSKLLPENPMTYFLRATAYDHLRDAKQASKYYHEFLNIAGGKFPDQEWQATHRLIAIEPKK